MKFKKQNKPAKKKKRDKPRSRLFTIENKLIVTRGEEGWGVMGETGDRD